MSNRHKLKRGMCLRKVRYATEAQAKAETELANRQLGANMHYYRCPFCNGYHKGHGERAKKGG